MSRIVGLFYRDGQAVEQTTLERLVAPLRPKASEGPRLWLSGAAALAYQCLQNSSELNGLQPATQVAGLAVCFDGRLDNREDLARVLAGELKVGAAELPDSDFVLACYRRFGETFASHLIGDFALILRDENQNKMMLARDVTGVRPLYFWTSGTTFLAGSEVKAILAHPEVEARPNDEGLANQIVGGNPNDLRLTCFKDVERVLPGWSVIVTPGSVRQFRHWDFDPTKQTRLGSNGEYAGALRALFEQAVRRRLRACTPVAVFVSGGLDSSAILCQAEKLRRAGAPLAQTFGVSMIFPTARRRMEKQYLRDVEAMYDVEIRRLMFDSFGFMDKDEEWLWHSEFPRLRWNSELQCLETARELGCSAILDGYFGDQMLYSDASFFDLARSFRWLRLQREFWALARSMTDSSPSLLRKELLQTFFRDLVPGWWLGPLRALRRLRNPQLSPRWYTRSLRDLAYQKSQEQRRHPGPFASKHAELCYLYFLLTYRLNMLEEMNKVAAVFGQERNFPFLDRDLVEFIMSIPGEVVNWQGIYKGLFREAMRETLPESIRQRYWKADFTLLDSSAAARNFSTYERYLHPDCCAVRFGYADPATLANSLSRHRARLTGETTFPAAQVSALVGLELWLRAFFRAR